MTTSGGRCADVACVSECGEEAHKTASLNGPLGGPGHAVASVCHSKGGHISADRSQSSPTPIRRVAGAGVARPVSFLSSLTDHPWARVQSSCTTSQSTTISML